MFVQIRCLILITINNCEVGIMRMTNGDIVNVNGIDNVKLKFHYGIIMTLKDVKYEIELKKKINFFR